MAQFSRLLRRFASDESGVFAVIFGLMAIVLIALGGAVVDYVALEQTKTRAQTALDAAALALQPRIFAPGFDENDAADLRALGDLAEAIMVERIGDARVTGGIPDGGITANVVDGSLYFRAGFTMPTTFVSLVGVRTLSAEVQSEATRKKLKLEVVMVLDNSGSMDKENRMPRLVDAAKCATYILMYDAVVDAPGNSNTCVPAPGAKPVPDVRIGIVPFTQSVNVGTSNANASWIDKTGASSIHFQNFDNDDDEDRLPQAAANYTFPTRQALFTATGEKWRGCVEARPHKKSGTLATAYLDTDDTPGTTGDTLFVPWFSPDWASGTGGNNYIEDSPPQCDRPAQGTTKCEVTEQRTRWSRYSSWEATTIQKSTVTGPVNFVSSAMTPGNPQFYGRLPPSCTCREQFFSNWEGSNTNQTRSATCTSFIPAGLSQRERQERVCKYYAGVSGSTFTSGPNDSCTRTPILPLTDNTADVISTINAMKAEGGTDIHEGAAWGFRVLSPGEPFAQGGDYDEAISKVMIIMTDGENRTYKSTNLNGSLFYSAYGFPYNSQNTTATSTSGKNVDRLGAASWNDFQLVTEMNTRTTQTCANAKDGDKITIYTIGLATDKVEQSTQATVQDMLTQCSTQPGRAKFPAYASELKSVFEDIANDLAALRLAL